MLDVGCRAHTLKAVLKVDQHCIVSWRCAAPKHGTLRASHDTTKSGYVFAGSRDGEAHLVTAALNESRGIAIALGKPAHALVIKMHEEFLLNVQPIRPRKEQTLGGA